MDTIPSFQNMKHLDPNNEDEKPKEDLDEDIGKIFEGEGPYSDDFSVNQLSHPVGSAVWKPGYVDETVAHTREIGAFLVRDKDLSFHRRDSFPHVHHTLKPNHHHFHKHHRSRRRGHDYSDEEDEEDDINEGPTEGEKQDQCDGKPRKKDAVAIVIEDFDGPEITFRPEKISPSKKKEPEVQIKPIPPPPESIRKRLYTDTSVMSTDDELHETSPLLSPDIAKLRPCIRPCETDTGGSEDEAAARKKGRVKFDIGSDAGEVDNENKEKLHRKRKHHHRKKQSFEDPKWRLYPGSEKQLSDIPFHHTPSEEEANQLKEHDLNEISSHRFEDKGVHRRHRVRAKSSVSSFIHLSEKQEQPSKDRQLPIMKKTYDHNPHEVFVELAELQHTNVGGMEWKETARWIKYEEDVEGVDNRWGKPHVAFLNFNSLFSLRKGLERGAVLLDLDEQDLPSIATRVVDHMVACDQIPYDQRDAVIKILLLRHKHIKEHQNAFRRASIKGSKIQLLGTSQEKLPTSHSATSLDGKSPGKRSFTNIFTANTFSSFSRNFSTDDATALANGTKPRSRANSYAQIEMENDFEAKEKIVRNLELLKKIPEGAEATAVLVGAVDFLKQPTIAFVRLAEGVVMENVVEVPIPVRFLFILLGPYDGSMDYHEVGRSISTLMSDKSFHEVAYRAHSRGQLLSAINDFLNASIVFPPSDWNNKDLIDVDEIRSKTQEMIKKKEEERAKKKIAQIKAEPPLAITGGDGGDDEGDGKPKRDPLVRKGKLFHGLIQDVKIRYSQYLSDLRDGLSAQVLSATIFIFFAALSPAVTFGGMYADLTDKYIGVGETLLVSSINGMIFALFAAQPLLIVGATGPLMIFDMSLLQFCNSSGLDYLSIRVWVGIWVFVIGLLVAAFEAVSVVKKFTRFTEEIFSTLVCIIFIYGAFEKLFIIFKKHPLQSYSCLPEEFNITGLNFTDMDDEIFDDDELVFNGTFIPTKEVEDGVVLTNQPNTALLSMCLMIGTFLIAWKLKKFRNSKFLGRGIRRALGDFGVPIAICLMVLLDILIQDTYTDKLSMPKGLQPSNSEVRGWLINPFGVVTALPLWCMFAAAPAALLLFILIFIEENICHLILSKPERCLKKGTGFHLDIVLSCLINTVSGFLGAPFMGPACVRTISHMSALTVMSSNVAPGESPKIVGCLEQRLSAFTVSLLVGLAVMLYAILNMVPSAVLLGIFLYMGVSATAGIQLLERTVLYLMPVKHHYNVPYVKKVRTRKMHVFTAIQLLLLAVLWVVTKSPASLGVPFILMCLIPIRLFLLPYLFTTKELIALDGAPQQASELEEDEPDFYEASHSLPTQIEENHHQS